MSDSKVTEFNILILSHDFDVNRFEEFSRMIAENDFRKEGDLISFRSSHDGRATANFLIQSLPDSSFELKGGNRYVKVLNGQIEETYGLAHLEKRIWV